MPAWEISEISGKRLSYGATRKKPRNREWWKAVDRYAKAVIHSFIHSISYPPLPLNLHLIYNLISIPIFALA
jgi:hypothetical protein